MSFLEHPIFICGAEQSGAALMLRYLDAHPDWFVCPGETGLIRHFYSRTPPEREKFFTQKYLFTHDIRSLIDPEYRTSKVFFKPNQINGAAFIESYKTFFQQKTVTLGNLHRAYARALHHGLRSDLKPALPVGFITQRPQDNELFAPALKKEFPQAKFIHLVRDPRTRYASVKQRGMRKRFGWACYRSPAHSDFASRHNEISLLSLHLARRNKQLLGADYQVVRYEDLTQQPEPTLRKIASFLSMEWNPILLRQTQLGKPFKGIQATGREPLRQYHRLTSPLERKLISLYVKEIATLFGYALQEPAPSRPDLWRHLAQESPWEYWRNRRFLRAKLAFPNRLLDGAFSSELQERALADPADLQPPNVRYREPIPQTALQAGAGR